MPYFSGEGLDHAREFYFGKPGPDCPFYKFKGFKGEFSSFNHPFDFPRGFGCAGVHDDRGPVYIFLAWEKAPVKIKIRDRNDIQLKSHNFRHTAIEIRDQAGHLFYRVYFK